MVDLDIRPVGAALGAEIHGIDLNTLTDDQMEAIHQAFADHLVLFFPEQDLTPDGHRRFAQRFGELEVVPSLTKLDDYKNSLVSLGLVTPTIIDKFIERKKRYKQLKAEVQAAGSNGANPS